MLPPSATCLWRHKTTTTWQLIWSVTSFSYMPLTSQNNNNLTVDMKCYLLQLHASDVTKQQQPDSWYEVLPLSLQLHASDVTKTTWQLIWSDASLCPFSCMLLTSLKPSWRVFHSSCPVCAKAYSPSCFWKNALASLTGSAFCDTPREFYALPFTYSLASIVVNVLRHVLSSLYHASFVPCSTLSG